MANPDPNEFTDREKFILSYYRSRELSGSRHMAFYDLAFIVISLINIVLFAVKGDLAYGFTGYLLVLGRLLYLLVEGGRWSRDFQSIFAKYDAQLQALKATQKTDGPKNS